MRSRRFRRWQERAARLAAVKIQIAEFIDDPAHPMCLKPHTVLTTDIDRRPATIAFGETQPMWRLISRL